MHYIKILTYIALIGYVNTTKTMQLLYDGTGYKIITQERCIDINPYDMSPLLQKMDLPKLKQFLNNGGHIRIHRLSNGDFFLRDYIPGPGGCPSHGILPLICISTLGTLAVVGITALTNHETGLISYCIGFSAFSTFALFEAIADHHNDRNDLLLPL